MSYGFKSLADTGIDISGHNDTDSQGNPAGGYARDTLPSHGRRHGFDITWQDGPVDRDAGDVPNGAFLEDVLEVCARRLEFYQGSRFACQENADALMHVRRAVDRLADRRRDRQDRGVQGKHEA